MKRLSPERELDIEFMAKKPEYACDILIGKRQTISNYKCKVWEALRELWEDREILKRELKEENERR